MNILLLRKIRPHSWPISATSFPSIARNTTSRAIARIVGWSAHRMEELITSNKILRPAYINMMEEREYVDLDGRP